MSQLFSSVIFSKVEQVNADQTQVTIKVEKIDVGMSGFIYHHISDGHGSILKNAVVTKFNKSTKMATLELSEFTALRNNALPDGKWIVEKGDDAILAFGYTRGLLITPTEEIYYRISKNTDIQWVHPDIFATILSFNSHPTPLREDFVKLSIATSTGLVFIYLDNRIYTLDAKTFRILNIAKVDLKQEAKELKLPFYMRVPEIATTWYKFGAGTSELEEYEPHYYSLLVEANPRNKTLYKIVKEGGEKLEDFLDDFELRERK